MYGARRLHEEGRMADERATAGNNQPSVAPHPRTAERARPSPTETLRRRHHELAILNAIAEALNREVDLGRALDATLKEVAALFGLRAGWVWLLREGSGATYLAAARDLPPALACAPERMEGRCYCLDTYREGDL